MDVMYLFCVFLIIPGTFGFSWENSEFVSDKMKTVLRGSMGEPVFENEDMSKRYKRDVQFETVEDVLKYLMKEIETLRGRVTLLEMDNAIFQQTIATVVRITDMKLSKYSCGCMKLMLKSDGVVPCEFTTVINTMPTEASASIEPTLTAPQCLHSVQYMDTPIDKPLEPGVMAVSYYGNQFFRYIFENNSTEVVSDDRAMTYAITFDPVGEKIIWASYKPSAIYSSLVDGTNFTTLLRDVLSYGLAVDGDKNLLFMTTVSPHRAVACVFTDGTGYRIIAHASRYGRPSRITLDMKNEVAFVSFRSRIIKVSYDGSQTSVLVRGKYITSLTFDNNNAILYYADRIIINKIMDTTEDTPKPERVIKFKPKTGSYPSDLFLKGDDMYIGYKFKKTVEVMSLANTTVSKLLFVDGEFVSLCLIA